MTTRTKVLRYRGRSYFYYQTDNKISIDIRDATFNLDFDSSASQITIRKFLKELIKNT